MTALPRELVRFGVVGSLGLLVDIGILALLVQGAGWSPFTARLVAMSIAVLTTWWLHRHWTFAEGKKRTALSQSLMYGTFQLITLSINYGVFSALVLAGGVWRAYPVAAAMVGSLIAMTITYLLAKRIAFADPDR